MQVKLELKIVSAENHTAPQRGAERGAESGAESGAERIVSTPIGDNPSIGEYPRCDHARDSGSHGNYIPYSP